MAATQLWIITRARFMVFLAKLGHSLNPTWLLRTSWHANCFRQQTRRVRLNHAHGSLPKMGQSKYDHGPPRWRSVGIPCRVDAL